MFFNVQNERGGCLALSVLVRSTENGVSPSEQTKDVRP